MRTRNTARALATACTLLIGGACSDQGDGVEFSDEELERIRAARLGDDALPPDPTNRFVDDPAAAHLGHYLFFDERFSLEDRVACATCHDPATGFGDGVRIPDNPYGDDEATRHTPDVSYTAWQDWFFWDGRADSSWSQALKPLENPAEHASNRTFIAHAIHSDPELRAAYEAVFGPMPDLDATDRFPADARPVPEQPDDPQNLAWIGMAEGDQLAVNEVFANFGKAIAAYEAQLARFRAPFDDFALGLETGDPDLLAAISPEAQQGLRLFMGDAGCHRCHPGPAFTDGEFHNVGLGSRLYIDAEDIGRYGGIAAVQTDEFNAAGRYSDAPESPRAARLLALSAADSDIGAFKTPSLRNVDLGSPYMHAGHIRFLDDAVAFFVYFPEEPAFGERESELVPLDLTEQDVANLVAFLETLTALPPRPLLSPPARPSP